jgi:hypothetical protein
LFRSLPEFLVVSDDFPPDAEIFDRHELIVVLKHASSNILIVEHVKEGWELQFIGSSPMGIVELGMNNAWKGYVHMRYGGKKHCKWWKLDRTSRDAMKIEKVRSINLGRDVNVLVYVREVKADLRLLRDQYLKMIGGQTRVYCKTHGKPLILNPSWEASNLKRCCKLLFGSNGTTVTDSRCEQKCQYQCSVKQCEVFICRKHIKQVQEMVDRNIVFYVGLSIEECGYESFDGNVDTKTEGSATSFGEIRVETSSTEDSLNEEERSMEEERDKKEENEEEEGTTTMIDRETTDEEDDGDLTDDEIDVGTVLLMTCGMEDQADVVTEMEGMEEAEDNDNEEDGFSCTNAGIACLHQEWTNETKKTGIINSYVLMRIRWEIVW